MFHHAKDLPFNARVSRPDLRFARRLLEQFGNGEARGPDSPGRQGSQRL